MAYTVKKGDTLNKIAAANGLSLSELLALNPGAFPNPDLIRPGDQVIVTTASTAGADTGDAGGNTGSTVPAEESKATPKTAASGDPTATILESDERKFYFDTSTGLWYVTYGLPGSNRRMMFEATPSQMDAIFGDGIRPGNYTTTGDISVLMQKPGVTFAGDVTEMYGEGSFEALYNEAISKAMDDGVLPSWMEGNDAAMDILFIAHTEEKSTDWVVNQLSTLPEFRKRFPGLQQYAESNNLTLVDAITGFLEFETHIKNLETQYGGNADSMTPGKVAALMNKGYSVSELDEAYKVGKRLEDNSEALSAFNAVLVANGSPPLTGTDMVKFLQGEAPAEVYEIYEAASFQEGAQAAGIGEYFTAEDALAAAQYTEASATMDSVLQGMNGAAQNLLRFRHDLDMSKYGLDHEDLVDISLGLPPRSGATSADIIESMSRATSEAQANRAQFQARPFTTFNSTGKIGAAGVSSGRATY